MFKEENLVQAEGSLEAPYLIIGEAPGAEEIQAGRPFVGRAGKLLDSLLNDAGILRSECFITNVCRYRPPENDFSVLRKKDNKPFFDTEVARLQREVLDSKAKVVICLGAEAASAIIGDRRISARRGFVEWINGRKVIATYHPAAVLRNIALYPIALFDFNKAKEEQTKDFTRLERNAIIRPTYSQAQGILESMHQSNGITFDIENTDEGIDCISFADSELHAITIPFTVQTEKDGKPWVGNYWSEEEELNLWGKIKDLLEDPGLEKCAQNAFYDMWHLQTQVNIHVKNVSHDTMIAAGLINAEFPKDLWFLASMYTDVAFWEDDTEKLADARWIYCAKDSMITYEIWRKQREEHKQLGVDRFFSQLPMSLLPYLVRASVRGVQFDHSRRGDLLKETSRTLEESVEEFRRLTGGRVNPRSYKQLSEYFIGTKGIKPILSKSTGNPTFSADVLTKLDAKYHLPETKSLLKIRELENKINFLEVKTGKDGRLRCSYNIAGTETGRLSSSEAPDRTGTNLQNWAHENRVLITAEEGCTFLKCDLKQAENRIVAYLAGDPFMIKIMEEGGDIHSKIAGMIFNKKEVTKKERQLGKKIGHASNYGMGPKRFKEVCYEEEGVEISVAEAKKLQEDYFTAFPKIRIWHEQVKAELSRSSRLVNPFGRVRTFLGFWGPELWKEAFAFLPQSTCVDCCNVAFIKLSELGLDTRLQTHDEILLSVPSNQIIPIAKKVKEVMEYPFKIGKYVVSIPVDISHGPNWLETKELQFE